MPRKRVASRRLTKKRQYEQFPEASGNLVSKKMDRAQIWSIDVLLAIVIFISIMIIFYVTINAKEKPELKDLQSEAKFLSAALEKNTAVGFIKEDVVDANKLDAFAVDASVNYDQIKESLGIVGDFCIYFEDEQGYLVVLKGNRTGVGKSVVNISDVPCGETI